MSDYDAWKTDYTGWYEKHTAPADPKPMSIDDAKEFVTDQIRNIGLGYHPDTNYYQYVEKSGTRSYTDLDARDLNHKTGLAFEAFEREGQVEDIYDFTMDQFREQFPEIFTEGA